MTVRTRMAPSPTGEFHIGGMRTYLYNYAFAKKNDGQMILRIEDTDKSREVEGGVVRIIQVIKDYGLDWDEGPDKGGSHAPYLQSQRLDIYKRHAEKLIEKSHAYYCFCSEERLTTLREEQKARGEITRYDKQCLSLRPEEMKKKLKAGSKYVIRMNVPGGKEISWADLVVGKVTINTNEVDDQILLKSDGFPTYHLAVVIDDHEMKVSHVLRGNEWLPSTPKQLLLYEFFGWKAPDFGHLPNLKELGANKKLSKRFGDVHAVNFLRSGYLPEALLNFLMFLGWNPGTDKEIFSVDEFVKEFSLERLTKSDMVAFDRERLLWLNGYYIRALSTEDLLTKVINWSQKFNVDLGFDLSVDAKVLRVVGLVQERLKTFAEFKDLVMYFFKEPIVNRDLLTSFAGDKTGEILENFIIFFATVISENWESKNLDRISHEFISKKDYKPKEAFMTLRIAVSGVTSTPPIFDTLGVLGKDKVLERLKIARSIYLE